VFLTGYSPFRSVGLPAKRDTGPCATTGNEPCLGDADNRNRSRTRTHSTRCRCSFESRISIAAKPWSWSSVKPYGPGPFRTGDIEQMRMGVLEHLKTAQGPAWLFAAELQEGTILRLLTPFERRVPIVAVRPPSRRLSTRVRLFIEQMKKTFALCSQFNPRPNTPPQRIVL
jgi:DNA-binding transcriptional LysR family regulator